MAISTAAKAGVAGTITAGGGGLTGTYLAWDHITLYEVEREVINEDVLIILRDLSEDSKKIIFEIPQLQSRGHSWLCEIDVETTTNNIDYAVFGKYIQSNLQTPGKGINDQHRKNKRALVKACSSNRGQQKTNSSIAGSLTLKETSEGKFTFIDHSNLDYLLKPSVDYLYDVELEAQKKGVTLKVEGPASSGNTVTIKAESNGSGGDDSTKLDNGYSWSCEITVDPSGKTSNAAAVKEKLDQKFPSTPKNTDHKNLVTALVKACSKNRKDGATPKSVVGQLRINVNTGTQPTYSVENNPELNSWFNPN